jgi:hypothetical protein
LLSLQLFSYKTATLGAWSLLRLFRLFLRSSARREATLLRGQL